MGHRFACKVGFGWVWEAQAAKRRRRFSFDRRHAGFWPRPCALAGGGGRAAPPASARLRALTRPANAKIVPFKDKSGAIFASSVRRTCSWRSLANHKLPCLQVCALSIEAYKGGKPNESSKIFAMCSRHRLLRSFAHVFPFSPSRKQTEFTVDFATERPSHLLKEATRRLPLYGLLFTLDYMSIEYDCMADKPHIAGVSFGFSRYLGFDMYDAICFAYDGRCVETSYMREEAKTIYDELYDAKAFISTHQRLLSQNIENLTVPFERMLARTLEEGASIDSDCNMYIDGQRNMIVFSN